MARPHAAPRLLLWEAVGVTLSGEHVAVPHGLRPPHRSVEWLNPVPPKASFPPVAGRAMALRRQAEHTASGRYDRLPIYSRSLAEWGQTWGAGPLARWVGGKTAGRRRG